MIEEKVQELSQKHLSDIVGKEVDEFIVSKDYFEIVFKGGPILKITIGGRPLSDQKWLDGLDIHLNNDLIWRTCNASSNDSI